MKVLKSPGIQPSNSPTAPKLFSKSILTLGEWNFLPISPNCNQVGSALRENWPSERDLDDFKWVWILHSAKMDENEFEEVHSIVSCLKWISEMLKNDFWSKMIIFDHGQNSRGFQHGFQMPF